MDLVAADCWSAVQVVKVDGAIGRCGFGADDGGAGAEFGHADREALRAQCEIGQADREALVARCEIGHADREALRARLLHIN